MLYEVITKRYSLFQALRKQVHIASLAVAYLYISLPQEAVAQTDTLKLNTDYNLDEIEVSRITSYNVCYTKLLRLIFMLELKTGFRHDD